MDEEQPEEDARIIPWNLFFKELQWQIKFLYKLYRQ